MALNMMGLGFVFEAVDHASHVITKIEERITGLEEHTGVAAEGIRSKMGTLGTGLGAMFTAFQGVEQVFGLAEAAGEAEQNLLSLKATTNATADEIAQMEEAAERLTEGLRFDDDTALNMLKKLRQQSFDTKAAIELLGPALNLALVSENKLSPDAAAQGLARVMKEYKIQTADAALAVDQMAHAVARWGFEASSLPSALARAQTGAEKINASMTDVMMVTALVKDGFRNQERAAQAVAAAMAKLADPKMGAQFDKLKERVSLTDANGEYRDFLTILRDLDPVLKKMGASGEASWLKDTFGENSIIEKTLAKIRGGIRNTNGELLTGAAAIAELRKGFLGAEGAADRMAKQLGAGFEEAVAVFGKVRGDLNEELGKGFAEVLTPAIRLATQALSTFLGWLKEIPGPVKTIGSAVFLGSMAVLGLVGALMAATAVWPFFTNAVAFGWKSLTLFTKAAWAAIVPMLPWVIGIGLIAGALYLFFFEGRRVTQWLSDFCSWLLKAAPILLLFANTVLFMSIPLGGFTAALAGLGTALAWVKGQLLLFYITLLLNPLGAVLGVVILATLWMVKLNGGWRGFVQAWKVGVEEMGIFFEKYLLKPLRDLWDGIVRVWNFLSGKKPGGPQANADAETGLELGIDKLVRVDRSGKVIGQGIQMDDLADADVAPVIPKLPASLQSAMGVNPENFQPGALDQDAVAKLLQRSEDREPMSIDYGRLADELAKRPLYATFEMDGEAVGNAMAKAQRGNFTRASMPVPPE